MASSEHLTLVRRASARAIAWQEKRDEEILKALQHHSIREVAEAAGLSPARIHQIRHGK